MHLRTNNDGRPLPTYLKPPSLAYKVIYASKWHAFHGIRPRRVGKFRKTVFPNYKT
jgi:hypothetical protein